MISIARTLLAPRTSAYAHCDLPCGVYDPAQARIEAALRLPMSNEARALVASAALLVQTGVVAPFALRLLKASFHAAEDAQQQLRHRIGRPVSVAP